MTTTSERQIHLTVAEASVLKSAAQTALAFMEMRQPRLRESLPAVRAAVDEVRRQLTEALESPSDGFTVPSDVPVGSEVYQSERWPTETEVRVALKRAEKASPGPWKSMPPTEHERDSRPRWYVSRLVGVQDVPPEKFYIAILSCGDERRDMADSEHIAAARTDLPRFGRALLEAFALVREALPWVDAPLYLGAQDEKLRALRDRMRRFIGRD
jgi:hypothetical protein